MPLVTENFMVLFGTFETFSLLDDVFDFWDVFFISYKVKKVKTKQLINFNFSQEISIHFSQETQQN